MASWSVVCVLAVVAVGHLTTADYDVRYGRHNITMGQRRSYPPDVLLFYDNPKMSGSWLPYPRVISHDVCYPPKGSHPARFVITAFNVTDVVPQGNGGFVFVTQGGVGRSLLCLHLKTQRGKGYNFITEIYGYYY